MEWRALEEHFREAGRQEPAPFGDGAFEWDHSRYARALGLTGEPGAHDLPHRACVVAALPPGRWDAAEKRLQGLAEPRGWAVWRVSARPTVAVPDAVTYALGVRAIGPDAFSLRRAARPIRPRDRRLQKEGLPFPLTTGERWLIATERVRRRMRTEIGTRGLVLFIEDAEWLTPAALALLMHLLDAERAWRARMLARAAHVYVVFAVAPGQETGVVRMLERFGLNGHPPVLRERRRPVAGVMPPILRDAEEEYLFGALAAAPVALSEEDVRGLFGASAVDRCRAMVERDLLRLRVEAGQVCYIANLAVSATAPMRALVAIAEGYRRKFRCGHEHLGLAAAAVDLMLGRAHRAVASVARMCHTAGALLPHRVFELLDAALERMRPKLKADHVAAWFSLAAHDRAYDHARELAGATTDRALRTWKELYRVVRVVLCTGRTHLDTCLPEDFWPRLKSQWIAGPFMDASCVLAELFWRKRYFSNDEIRQRYEFACDCFERGESEKPRGPWFGRLERVARLVIYRAALHLEVPTRILSTPSIWSPTLRTFLHREQLPAYLVAAAVFIETATNELCMPRSFSKTDRSFAMFLGASTGNPADLVVPIAMEGRRLWWRGLRLLLRDVFDDLLLVLRYRPSPTDRRDGPRFFIFLAGGRGRLVGTNALFLRHGRQDIPGGDAFDEMAVAAELMFVGDLVGARDQLALALARAVSCPYLLAETIVLHATIAIKSLDAEMLCLTRALIEQHQRILGPDLCRYLDAFVQGSRALLSADLDAARRCFATSHASLRGSAERAVMLKRTAMTRSLEIGYVQRVIALWSTGTFRRPGVWKVIKRVCAGPSWRSAIRSVDKKAAICLEYVFAILDAWVVVDRDDDDVLRAALFLKDAVDATFRQLGCGFAQLAARWAPRFYENLSRAVAARVGVGLSAPEARALDASLRTIEGVWPVEHLSAVGGRRDRIRIRADGSHAKRARRMSVEWYDDATTYARLWEGTGLSRTLVGGERVVVAYGYVGPSESKPVATPLRFVVVPLDESGFEVEVGALGNASAGMRHAKRKGITGFAFIGRSEAAKKVRAFIDTATRCSYPVLILGETGVGKDLVARCIHAGSEKRMKPLVTIECAGIVDGLLESELFGHEKGAFTGAHASHQGVFERADGAALLLDEADSMPRRMQAAVLRVLESGEYRRVGSSSTRGSSFRLMTAALPRLLRMVESGEFRQDLFYRISTLRIEVPPLRERDGDVEEIAEAHARTLGLRLTAAARQVIGAYDWPGNVRQLQHCIQAAGLHAVDIRIGGAAMNEIIGSYRGNQAAGEDGSEIPDAAWMRALRTLERMNRFGTWDFAQAADLSRRSAQRQIARLLREGRIVRIGAGRATRYGIQS
ncbi:MAG TPA: sigma 54-interacting transcriptional regulator [Planctomycetota bacterium]|nr:sigma 54-interacting transcriptional regulator [Planctomycetota bacterium]